jgi:hypothetical protein
MLDKIRCMWSNINTKSKVGVCAAIFASILILCTFPYCVDHKCYIDFGIIDYFVIGFLGFMFILLGGVSTYYICYVIISAAEELFIHGGSNIIQIGSEIVDELYGFICLMWKPAYFVINLIVLVCALCIVFGYAIRSIVCY